MTSHRNDLDQPIGAPVLDWTARPHPDGRTLAGRFCRLERLDPDGHGADLFAADSADREGRSWTYLPYGPFAGVGDYMGWLRAQAALSDPFFYTIVEAEGGKPVGLASYLRIAPEAGAIEVGHLHFSPALQRRPAATEAMALMMAHAFEDLGYRRYEWKCNALNAASCRAAERLGFTFEGVFRQAGVVKGHNRDTAWYSILDHEWPGMKRAFESWLSPGNFEEDGTQRRALRDFRPA
ncbi:GNAT family N-acetyltransferase [Marivibrio halodurans]|uniref:GNAT family N-acetyltransferase n=1 Tax=Marivibrio halodurans TaxID=2039722 RepID=A0A8J7V3B3_9PROT|nr:GNAT family protein [Marivibrio halodurans]MBP5856639.1 GNAT family N-acetyltransferase [Marivibrio halodurans]